jgi:capsid protein
MRTFLHRLLGLARPRGFDAAGGGRRWEGARTVDGLTGAILAGATTAARRAGWYARNNPWVAAAVDSLVGNVVGAGIKPQSTHTDRAVRERRQALWLHWTDHADPSGLADFFGLQAMAVRAMVECPWNIRVVRVEWREELVSRRTRLVRVQAIFERAMNRKIFGFVLIIFHQLAVKRICTRDRLSHHVGGGCRRVRNPTLRACLRRVMPIA